MMMMTEMVEAVMTVATSALTGEEVWKNTKVCHLM
jgi:hypothetical protein